MSTLVVCVDRDDDIGRETGIQTPVAGWEAVRSLVTDIGLADPEDSSVNCLLEALRVTRDLRDEDEDATVAVISGAADTRVGSDRAVARQMDALIERHGPDSAVIVIDSSEDERLVPIIESRVRVDAVDRVVVRQARDLESTYYLLKQFLADEELRQTVLVPIGVVMLAFPILLFLAQSPTVAVAVITTVIGVFVLYKGLGIDAYVADIPVQVRDALYSGRVSIVTYAVGVGLALIGAFVGVLAVSDLPDKQEILIPAMTFAFYSVPWLALAALAASTGRLLDEVIRNETVSNSYMNLPFGVVAIGFVIRGFAAYFLELSGTIGHLSVPPIEAGVISVDGFALTPGMRLAVFVTIGVLISLLGVRISSRVSGTATEEPGEELLE